MGGPTGASARRQGSRRKAAPTGGGRGRDLQAGDFGGFGEFGAFVFGAHLGLELAVGGVLLWSKDGTRVLDEWIGQDGAIRSAGDGVFFQQSVELVDGLGCERRVGIAQARGEGFEAKAAEIGFAFLAQRVKAGVFFFAKDGFGFGFDVLLLFLPQGDGVGLLGTVVAEHGTVI